MKILNILTKRLKLYLRSAADYLYWGIIGKKRAEKVKSYFTSFFENIRYWLSDKKPEKDVGIIIQSLSQSVLSVRTTMEKTVYSLKKDNILKSKINEILKNILRFMVKLTKNENNSILINRLIIQSIPQLAVIWQLNKTKENLNLVRITIKETIYSLKKDTNFEPKIDEILKNILQFMVKLTKNESDSILINIYFYFLAEIFCSIEMGENSVYNDFFLSEIKFNPCDPIYKEIFLQLFMCYVSPITTNNKEFFDILAARYGITNLAQLHQIYGQEKSLEERKKRLHIVIEDTKNLEEFCSYLSSLNFMTKQWQINSVKSLEKSILIIDLMKHIFTFCVKKNSASELFISKAKREISKAVSNIFMDNDSYSFELINIYFSLIVAILYIDYNGTTKIGEIFEDSKIDISNPPVEFINFLLFYYHTDPENNNVKEYFKSLIGSKNLNEIRSNITLSEKEETDFNKLLDYTGLGHPKPKLFIFTPNNIFSGTEKEKKI